MVTTRVSVLLLLLLHLLDENNLTTHQWVTTSETLVAPNTNKKWTVFKRNIVKVPNWALSMASCLLGGLFSLPGNSGVFSEIHLSAVTFTILYRC